MKLKFGIILYFVVIQVIYSSENEKNTKNKFLVLKDAKFLNQNLSNEKEKQKNDEQLKAYNKLKSEIPIMKTINIIEHKKVIKNLSEEDVILNLFATI